MKTDAIKCGEQLIMGMLFEGTAYSMEMSREKAVRILSALRQTGWNHNTETVSVDALICQRNELLEALKGLVPTANNWACRCEIAGEAACRNARTAIANVEATPK